MPWYIVLLVVPWFYHHVNNHFAEWGPSPKIGMALGLGSIMAPQWLPGSLVTGSLVAWLPNGFLAPWLPSGSLAPSY